MGGHGLPLRKTKYFTINDIPDSMVPTEIKRDPDNKIYKTRRWYDFKKSQILHTQNDGVPCYLRTPMRRLYYYSVYGTTIGLFFYNLYGLYYYMNKKK